jgi:hypothetical protein
MSDSGRGVPNDRRRQDHIPGPTADLYRSDYGRDRPPPEHPNDRRRQDYIPGPTADLYRPDYGRDRSLADLYRLDYGRDRPPPEHPNDRRRQDHIPAPTADRYHLDYIGRQQDRDRERDNERERPLPEGPDDRRRQEPRPIPRPAERRQHDRDRERDNERGRPLPEGPDDRRRQEPRPIPRPAERRQLETSGHHQSSERPPVEFPTDLPVRPSCRRPRVPQTSTIAPGHRPVYLAIFDNPVGESGPNHWGLYVPYANDESGTMTSANRSSGQWKIQFSRNYGPNMSRFLVWFFYLGQVPQGSFTDYSHLLGRQYSDSPDGELEEVTRAIPLPRSELRVSFDLDNNLTPGRFD